VNGSVSITISRILLAAAATAGLVGASGAVPTTQTTEPVTLAAVSSSLDGNTGLHLGFCPFGKAHKHGRGCRFGSIKNVVKPAKRCAAAGSEGAMAGYEAGGEAGPAAALVVGGVTCAVAAAH
jgi:hypothetical protein